MSREGTLDNLERLDDELRGHRTTDLSCNCNGRWFRNAGTAGRIATEMPLSCTANTNTFKAICQDGEIRSQRLLNGGKPKLRPDGSNTLEYLLGTDDDVFAFAGPIRYPQVDPVGLLFAPDLEQQHTGPKAATPFDSGGCFSAFQPKTASDRTLSPIAFLGRYEMPVPGYRNYMAEFLATAFENPLEYLMDQPGPACEASIMVEAVISGCDARRWTFETRFARMIDIGWSLRVIFIPKVIEKEDWCLDAIADLKAKDVRHEPYGVSRGEDAWDSVRRKCREFLQRTFGS